VVLAKQRPGQFTYASAGFGTGGHMASEMLKLAAGVDMLHVPYKGASPAWRRPKRATLRYLSV